VICSFCLGFCLLLKKIFKKTKKKKGRAEAVLPPPPCVDFQVPSVVPLRAPPAGFGPDLAERITRPRQLAVPTPSGCCACSVPCLAVQTSDLHQAQVSFKQPEFGPCRHGAGPVREIAQLRHAGRALLFHFHFPPHAGAFFPKRRLAFPLLRAFKTSAKAAPLESVRQAPQDPSLQVPKTPPDVEMPIFGRLPACTLASICAPIFQPLAEPSAFIVTADPVSPNGAETANLAPAFERSPSPFCFPAFRAPLWPEFTT